MQNDASLENIEQLDLPVIVRNEWVAVYDVTTGGWQGELQVLLAAGSQSQMHKLASALMGNRHTKVRSPCEVAQSELKPFLDSLNCAEKLSVDGYMQGQIVHLNIAI